MWEESEVWQDARIIAADDAPANLRLLERILRRAGYSDIRTAVDGLGALDLICAEEPDLLLLDIQMPGLDGAGVLTAMASIFSADSFVPVVVLTADISPETRTRMLALGAMDFVTKPFDPAEVVLRVRNLLRTRFLHRRMEEIIRVRTQSLRDAHQEILERLAQAGELRDDDTGSHARRVGNVSARIGEAMGLPAHVIDLLRRAAPLHDVGKIGVSDAVLLKAGRLSDEEQAHMRRHTEVGASILADGRADVVCVAERIALSHHEKWDGTGYPAGLRGDEIPLVARIVADADVFDALSHDRPYRAAWPRDSVIREIRNGRGKHFDPEVVDAFLRMLEKGDPTDLGDGADPPDGVSDRKVLYGFARGTMAASRQGRGLDPDTSLSEDVVFHSLVDLPH